MKYSDRRVAAVLLAFFLALYLLTSAGHGYSPDGEFAWRMARSILLDPKHEYARSMRKGLNQWGFVVPALSSPLVAAGEVLRGVEPQKDYATVDGRQYVLGIFRPRNAPKDAPTVGPNGPGVSDLYTRSKLNGEPATSLVMISFLALSKDIPQSATVAELTLQDFAGDGVTLPLRAGVETAEWSLGKTPANADHQMARVASVWAGNTEGRNYYVELPFGRELAPQELQIRYLLPEGHLYVRSLALVNSQTGGFQPIPSDFRFWSYRENDELFSRAVDSAYNGIVTALGCVLLFALTRLLGYSQAVSIAGTIVYGVATLAWPYSKYDFSEPTLVLFVLLTLYLILRWDQGREEGSLGTPQTPRSGSAAVSAAREFPAPARRQRSDSPGALSSPSGDRQDADAPGAEPRNYLPPLPGGEGRGEGRIRSTQRSALSTRHSAKRRDWLLLIAGIAALACVGTKYASGVLVPLMLLQIALLHWKRHPSLRDLPGLFRPALLFCLPFLVVAAPALAYLMLTTGYEPSIVRAWAGVQTGWLPLPIWMGLGGLLFSPGKSFFLYSPPTVLALASVVPFVRRHGVRAFGFLAIALVYFTIYSKKSAWHAGAGWGPRYQVLVIPLVILIMAPLIQKAIEERRAWARYALLTTFVLGVGIQLLGVSKSFDDYLGIFRSQVVTQLPDQGRQYSMIPEYFDEAAGLDDGNSITATVLAWPFSPILAHAWLLSGNILAIGPSFLQPAKDRVLANPPWKLWGIDVTPANPEYGLNLDFWSMKMRTDFPSYPVFLAGVAVVVLLLEAVLVLSGARIVALLFSRSKRRPEAVKAWLVASIIVLLIFDGIHFVL